MAHDRVFIIDSFFFISFLFCFLYFFARLCISYPSLILCMSVDHILNFASFFYFLYLLVLFLYVILLPFSIRQRTQRIHFNRIINLSAPSLRHQYKVIKKHNNNNNEISNMIIILFSTVTYFGRLGLYRMTSRNYV